MDRLCRPGRRRPATASLGQNNRRAAGSETRRNGRFPGRSPPRAWPGRRNSAVNLTEVTIRELSERRGQSNSSRSHRKAGTAPTILGLALSRLTAGRPRAVTLKSNVAGPRRGTAEIERWHRPARLFVISVLIGSLLILAPAEAAQSRPPLAAQVERLAQQLDSPRLNERDAAERQLLELGAPILPLLPAIDQRTSGEVATRLARLQQTLLRTGRGGGRCHVGNVEGQGSAAIRRAGDDRQANRQRDRRSSGRFWRGATRVASFGRIRQNSVLAGD